MSLLLAAVVFNFELVISTCMTETVTRKVLYAVHTQQLALNLLGLVVSKANPECHVSIEIHPELLRIGRHTDRQTHKQTKT